ncbi:DNase I-like protein [Piedraia hortae CBS 480.64]|uniref:phosphoinositide 5-phosphatase n=1 Tax=Piedraia hortae CBS 480.64 TaxID=1314780 RepID=A0A6A7C8G1_9PEZI|nr:DNase I-like protein [Piedraia hortae CBS 480.64]
MKLLIRDRPRALALATDDHVLILRRSPHAHISSKCIVEFSHSQHVVLGDYRPLSLPVKGTLGLVALNNDVFLCVVNASSTVATVRPGETVQRILAVEFYSLSRSDYDHLLGGNLDDATEPEPMVEHPCLSLKKLLSGGSFYYSADFDLTRRLQNRPSDCSTVAIDSLDDGFLWNTYMIQPLVDFRSRLSDKEKRALDSSGILTSAIRGFVSTLKVSASASPARSNHSGMASNLTLISRLSCRRAGTRFNARGVDDYGNVANFVETETIFSTDAVCFSSVQCRGSVPVFWEQTSGLPGQQKITISRSLEATQPAFDKHFEMLTKAYGNVFVVNLLSDEKNQETMMTKQYMRLIKNSPLNDRKGDSTESEHAQIRHINYDFHAQTRGPTGYEAASGIRRYIERASLAFEYFLSIPRNSEAPENIVLSQSGIFRTNCLDCLDRTNLIQTIISQLALENFLSQHSNERAGSDFWARHGTLWADNGDALSKIYAGTGALKSSFTRTGKMSVAGMLADVRKSAHRLYVNNFEDKSRQQTMDILLGRQAGQLSVHLHDPINDWVNTSLKQQIHTYTHHQTLTIYCGTFNLNGKITGLNTDLSPWLCPTPQSPADLAVIAFQEIVDLDVGQIVNADLNRRTLWESKVLSTLNTHCPPGDPYILLRGVQLVGASLSLFTKTSLLPQLTNIEASVKKTGMSGMAGNKGACAIRLDFANTTSLCFVTAHLAAGFSNYEERNNDYHTISHGLRFQRDRAIADHDAVIWAGDFNYRIGMSNERARALIEKKDFGELYANDQLNLQMVHGRVFEHYHETMPRFRPTYRFDLGREGYDSSEKARIPAWTDRIVSRGEGLQQMVYDSCEELMFSDHRPVYGMFECVVTVVEMERKEELEERLRAEAVLRGTQEEEGSESEWEGEGEGEGLPPPSSEKRKWWLDDGMPVKVTLSPPREGRFVINPTRNSNPFKEGGEEDWVRVERGEEGRSAQRPKVKPKPEELRGGKKGGEKPALPPRRATNIMDDDADVRELEGWVPLKPS